MDNYLPSVFGENDNDCSTSHGAVENSARPFRPLPAVLINVHSENAAELIIYTRPFGVII